MTRLVSCAAKNWQFLQYVGIILGEKAEKIQSLWHVVWSEDVDKGNGVVTITVITIRS